MQYILSSIHSFSLTHLASFHRQISMLLQSVCKDNIVPLLMKSQTNSNANQLKLKFLFATFEHSTLVYVYNTSNYVRFE